MKKVCITLLIFLLLCLGLAPVLVASPLVMATSPVNKISLSPFVHIKNSTVTGVSDGIGYVDSVINITNGVLPVPYGNTTEILDTSYTFYNLFTINIYGESQITINNTIMSSAALFVYGSSQVTLINSAFGALYTFDSAKVTLKNGSSIVGVPIGITAMDSSEISIIDSAVSCLSLHNNSRVYAWESQLNIADPNYILELFDNSYLYANNCSINAPFIANAYDFSTAMITNQSTVGYFASLDAANTTFVNSSITVLDYGLVANSGSLTIVGSTPPDMTNGRNTTTLINTTPSVQNLISVCALDNSNVNITNNNSISHVFARDGSTVYLENATSPTYYLNIMCTDSSSTTYKNSQQDLLVSCYKSSSLTLFNISDASHSIQLFDHSSATVRNSSYTGLLDSLIFQSFDYSTALVENIAFTGISGISMGSFNSSVVDIVNVTHPSVGITGNAFFSFDLSVMTINSSKINRVDYAVKSNGDMSVTNGALGGNYINTTTWNNPIGSVTNKYLGSIAVVGTDSCTISDSLLGTTVYLHDRAALNSTNNIYGGNSRGIFAYDSSSISGMNTTVGNIVMLQKSGANLSNITVDIVIVEESATFICTGNPSAPSNLTSVTAVSYLPHMVNVDIDNCTVGTLSGVTWIIQAAGVSYMLPLLLLMVPQDQTFLILALAGIGIVAVIALSAILLRRRA